MSLENRSDNMCVECEVRLPKFKREYYANRFQSVVSLEILKGGALHCIKLEQLDRYGFKVPFCDSTSLRI